MASLSFHSVFTSHAVLQRRKPIRLSGHCAPEAALTVDFAGSHVRAVGGADGRWSAVLPPMEAGGPYTLRLSDGEQSVVLEDMLVGDVWFCSGQSNMEFPVAGDRGIFRLPPGEGEAVQAQGANPLIRLCNCQRRLCETPQEEVGDSVFWRPCDADSLRDFSAVAYFFGRKLQADMKVPIGLIHCSWGGSGIEPWISGEKFIQSGEGLPTQTEAEWQAQWRAQLAAHPEVQQWIDAFEAAMPPVDPAWLKDDFDDSDWEADQTGTAPMMTGGRQISRIFFDVPAAFAGKALTLTYGPVMDLDETYLNGQLIGRTRQDGYQGTIAMRHYAVPAGLLKKGRNLLVCVLDGHNSGTIETLGMVLTAPDGAFKQYEYLHFRSKVVGHKPADFPPKPALPPTSNSGLYMPFNITRPASMFNGMAAPWTRYDIKGVIWYQGCTNHGRFDYYKHHQMLIDDWRERWHDLEMPFLIVQLAAFSGVDTVPAGCTDEMAADALPVGELSGYAVVREIQAEMPRCRRNIGIVVAMDVGDAFNIHPFDKRTVGERLALKAESLLGETAAVADGPEFDGIRYEEGRIRVFFRNVGSGLTTTDGEPPKGFWICNALDVGCTVHKADCLFHRANARIEGNTVVVWNDEVPFPQRVRYAFTGFCKVNLCNREGLPAVPFRSDKCDYAAMMRP